MEKTYSLEEFGVTKHQTTLQNGLQVIFIEKPFAPIYAKIEMAAGSVFNPCDNGLAHLTEHLLVHESKTTSMESIGAFKNGSTSKDWMSVDVEIAEVSHLPYMKKYFADSLEHISITAESLQKEKEIIFSELQRARSKRAYDQSIELMNILTQQGPWGYSNFGVPEYMNTITIHDIETFFSTYCVAENSTLIIAGGCTLSDIENNFSDIRLLHGKKSTPPQSPAVIDPNQRLFFLKNTPETNVLISFNGPAANTRESYILDFALSFAHRGIHSFFYRNIRTIKSLSYSVEKISLVFNNDVKYFGTEIGVPANKVDEAIDALLETYHLFIEEEITQQQIEHHITAMYFSTKRNNERAVDWVDMFSSTIYEEKNPVVGDFPDIYNFLKTITAEEVHQVLKKYITFENFHVCVFGKEPSKKYC